MTLAQKVAKFLNEELLFPPTLCNKVLDVLREGISEAAWDIEGVFNEFNEHSDDPLDDGCPICGLTRPHTGHGAS